MLPQGFRILYLQSFIVICLPSFFYASRLFMFGGGVWSSDRGWHTKLNELCIYDTRSSALRHYRSKRPRSKPLVAGSGQWSAMPVTKSSPAVCSYPFMFAVGCHIFVFGIIASNSFTRTISGLLTHMAVSFLQAGKASPILQSPTTYTSSIQVRYPQSFQY